MTARLATVLAALIVCSPALAQTVIVNETFDSYADTNAMQAVWTPDLGMGTQPQPGPYGILVPDTGAGLTPPYDNPPGIQGKAVNMLANINEYNGPNVGMMANLVPTATQSIRLSADIFDNNEIRRSGVGIRNDSVFREFGVTGWNFIEMGYYNTRDLDPTKPEDDPEATLNFTGYAYRIALFGAVGGDLLRHPNWQNFDLDPALDRLDDEDEFTSQADIGPGWHRFTTIIGIDSVTLTLDLFRDGLKNTEATEGVGVDGVDASVTWMITPHDDATEPNAFDPFNSLRFGSHSGIGNTVEAVVDNIRLELIDVAMPPDGDPDFDNDGDVDGADFLTWQRGIGLTGTTNQFGDADDDGDVDGDDLMHWRDMFGRTDMPVSTVAAAGVPEPSSLALGFAALAALAAVRRRHS